MLVNRHSVVFACVLQGIGPFHVNYRARGPEAVHAEFLYASGGSCCLQTDSPGLLSSVPNPSEQGIHLTDFYSEGQLWGFLYCFDI